MNESITDVFEGRHRHARTGATIAALAFVFAQLDAMDGRPAAPAARARDRASPPTAADLAHYRLTRSDFGCGTGRQAESSLRRAHAQREKGWLTDDEFKNIEHRCLGSIASDPKWRSGPGRDRTR